MTKVGRFTVWVIVAVIAIIVVYFMAYSGMDQAIPPPRADASKP
jgi:Na+/melibiose symporter-like transporter